MVWKVWVGVNERWKYWLWKTQFVVVVFCVVD